MTPAQWLEQALHSSDDGGWTADSGMGGAVGGAVGGGANYTSDSDDEFLLEDFTPDDAPDTDSDADDAEAAREQLDETVQILFCSRTFVYSFPLSLTA